MDTGHRPFPPSPRRLGLARASGLTAASPSVVGAAAFVGTLAVIAIVGRAMAARASTWIAEACTASDGNAQSIAGGGFQSSASRDSVTTIHVLDLDASVRAILELALPLLVAAALAAVVAHVSQTRAFWMPRRTLTGAPAVPPHRMAWASFDVASIVTVGSVTLAWLWLTAPRLANLFHEPSAAGFALVSFVATLAIAWVALSAIDALVRRHHLASALSMTHDEKREDDRLTAADPRWRAQRLSIMREGVGAAVARAAVVVIDGDIAVAIAWDPARQPVPTRTATGRRAHAIQLIALARRHRIAVHRDATLARVLADNEGPVPEASWPRLAEIIAAVRPR